jgi:hypothetical protein
MKNIQILIILLFSIEVSAQNITEINSDLRLNDTLTYETEVRIYQGGGISNYSSLLRMFKDKSEKWTAEFYEHFAKVDGVTELRTEKRNLKSENDVEFIFLNLVRSHIFDLPSLNEIKWKLVTRSNVEKVKNKYRDKEIEEYELTNKKIAVLDGEVFKVQVKSRSKTNEFEYYNPEEYLKHYTEIDELNYIVEILNLIRSEFGVMKK